jgi:dienelactone hydrolase
MHQDIIDVELEGARMRVESTEGCSRAALFLPGISGGVMTDRFSPLGAMLEKEGWAFARLEIWEGEEDVQAMTMTSIHDALRAALDELNDEGFGTIAGIGKSFGGGMLLAYVDPRITKKILWAPAIGESEEGNLVLTKGVKLATIQNLLDIKIPARQIAADPSEIIILHGTEDSIIPIENSESIMAARGGAIVPIEGADHSFKVKAHEEALLKATQKALQ